MGKTRTANAGVSIFKTESHVVEHKKRKSSEISIYDHGVQRGAPQQLSGAPLGPSPLTFDMLSSITVPARQHPAFSGVTIKRQRLGGSTAGATLIPGNNALTSTITTSALPLAPPLMPMPPVPQFRPDVAVQQSLTAMRARQRAAASLASTLTAPSANVDPIPGLSMRRTRSQGPPSPVPSGAPSTLAPPALPMNCFSGLSGLPMISGLSGLVADGLEALDAQLPTEGDAPLLGSPMRRARSRGLPSASGLGDVVPDGFEALVAPAPADAPPSDAPPSDTSPPDAPPRDAPPPDAAPPDASPPAPLSTVPASPPTPPSEVATVAAVTEVSTAVMAAEVAVTAEPPWRNDPAFLRKIGVAIPCHKSADEIARTLRPLLLYFEPSHIVVCDNGNALTPGDHDNNATASEVRQVYEDYLKGLPDDLRQTKAPIQYLFIPEGQKMQALTLGSIRLSQTCHNVEYVMHIDDDTILSDAMVFDESLFTRNPNLVAVAFPRTVDCSAGSTLVSRSVDFFYKKADHMGWAQACLSGTRPYVPGPCGLWKLSVYHKMIERHPFLPFGEDIFGSYVALCLDERRYCFTSEMRCKVQTFGPPSLTQCSCSCIYGTGKKERVQGYGSASLWKQRAHRWCVSGCRVLPYSVFCFFFYRGSYDGGTPTCTEIIWYRIFRIREYKMIVLQLFLLPFIFYLLATAHTIVISVEGLAIFAAVKSTLTLVDVVRGAWINYWCWQNRPDVQVGLDVVLFAGVFDDFLNLCATFGRWKCLLFYIPLVPMRTGLMTPLLKAAHPEHD